MDCKDRDCDACKQRLSDFPEGTRVKRQIRVRGKVRTVLLCPYCAKAQSFITAIQTGWGERRKA